MHKRSLVYYYAYTYCMAWMHIHAVWYGISMSWHGMISCMGIHHPLSSIISLEILSQRHHRYIAHCSISISFSMSALSVCLSISLSVPHLLSFDHGLPLL